MPRQRRKARPPKRPRKPLNLDGLAPREVVFYVVRFLVKTPDELRHGTEAPEWMKRESPPTLDEDEAAAAYADIVDQIESTPNLGLRAPQLLRRTVTEEILNDHTAEQGIAAAGSIDDRLAEANAEAGEGDELEQLLDTLAIE